MLGLILGVAAAVATNLAFVFKHRGAVLAPPIEVRHPLRSAAGLFRSKWFAVGWSVAVVAWLLHVGALSLAPLPIVQAVLSGGLVFLAVSVIGLTGAGAKDTERASLTALIAVESAIFALGAALVTNHGSQGWAASAPCCSAGPDDLDRLADCIGQEICVALRRPDRHARV